MKRKGGMNLSRALALIFTLALVGWTSVGLLVWGLVALMGWLRG